MALVVSADELIPLLFTPAYAPAAAIFRCYSVLTFLRVAGYGHMILVAGRPRLVVVAAGLGLFYNALFGIPFVLVLGFVGPAAGAACAFIVQIVTYVFLIARAAGVSPRDVFPVGAYLRVFALACVAGAVGWTIRGALTVPIGWLLAAELTSVLGVFALLGTLTGTISRTDWAYVRDWLKVKH
jgi:O-antigen/teichoic acid export membrane protein